jgi:hypothetical protein
MSKEAWASVVLHFSLALPFLVLCFSLPVPSLVLCLLLHHWGPARRGRKRLPLRTTKARTTNEFAFLSPFAPNVLGPGIEQSGYWKFDAGMSIVRNDTALFLRDHGKAVHGFVRYAAGWVPGKFHLSDYATSRNYIRRCISHRTTAGP